uniref:Putative ATP-dependent RNA helicase DDX46 (Trinotate prediction) n=1 Tax=Henneguya salminicola TaxID=69463 RepID=A0A6G3MHC2_HENSL
MAIDKNRRIKTSGFSGRGFKFDDRELLHSSESKKMIKWTFGWQDSGDEAEEEKRVLKKIEVDIDKAFSSRPRASNVKQIATVDKDRMELAQSIATKLNEKLKAVHNQNQEIYDQVVKPVVKPKPEVVSHNATMDIAKEVAGKLNMKLNEEAMKPSRTETTRKLTVGEVFFEEIDINDFPQLARQRITSKEALDAVAEMADCALTVRGTYCPAGKSIDFSDRRLHLLIEGNTEFKVQIAKADVKRIIKEECIKSDYAFIQPSSRYKIT